MDDVPHWDGIVIGSGLGGLAAAAALSARGKRVLVLERHDSFGGAASCYRRGSLNLEASLHETDGDTVNSANGPFARLGLTGAVEPIATDEFYEVRGGGLQPIRVPHGLDSAQASLVAAMPESRRAIGSFFRDASRLYRSFKDLEDLAVRGPVVLAGLILSGRLFQLLVDSRRTLHHRFCSIFGDHERPKLVLGAPISYFDDDPRRLSYLLYTAVWSRYAEAGSCYFKGGSSALAAALVRLIQERGGTVQGSSNVRSINLDSDTRASGVTYTDAAGDPHEVHATVVLANASPAAVEAMLPVASRRVFSRPYERFEPSISLFTVSLGLTRAAMDFGVSAYSTFIYPDSMTRFADMAKAAAVFGGAPTGCLPPYVLANYGAIDSGLRGPDELRLLTVSGIDRLTWWQGLDEDGERRRRDQWIDALVFDLDRRYPGLRSAIAQREIVTSRNLRNWMGTGQGEVYGFRPTPSRLFSRRPTAVTALPGLLLGSAYTVTGGYAGAMQGGLMAADVALRELQCLRRNRRSGVVGS